MVQIEDLEDESLTEFTVEVDENCSLDCGFIIAVSVPRQEEGLVVDSKIPVSKVFDLAMPHVNHYSKTIKVIQVINSNGQLCCSNIGATRVRY